MNDKRLREAVIFMQRYADQSARLEELQSIQSSVLAARQEIEGETPGNPPATIAARSVNDLVWQSPVVAAQQILIIHAAESSVQAEEDAFQCGLLRDVFGGKFHPTVMDNRWRTSSVVDLAHAICEQFACERMPVLGDALMDAGCESKAIISHCRAEQLHVRGCWVLDLILDKKETGQGPPYGNRS